MSIGEYRQHASLLHNHIRSSSSSRVHMCRPMTRAIYVAFAGALSGTLHSSVDRAESQRMAAAEETTEELVGDAAPAKSRKRPADQMSGTNGEAAEGDHHHDNANDTRHDGPPATVKEHAHAGGEGGVEEKLQGDGGDGNGSPKKKKAKKKGGAGGAGGGGNQQQKGAGGGKKGKKPGQAPPKQKGPSLITFEELRPGREEPSNVLLARIADGQFPVTLDALYTLFSLFGPVQKIVMFNKGAGNQALVQYPDVNSAMLAHDQVDNRNMYTDSNLIRVGYSNLTNLIVRANTDRSWDYTKAAAEPANKQQATAASGTAEDGGNAPAAVTGPVDPGLKASIRERVIADMPTEWSKKLPGTDTCVLLVSGLNLEMVGAEALAALFGVYGDVVKVKMLPSSESALVQMEKPVQAYVAKWLLDAAPLGGRIIKVKPSMQEAIRDATAQDFTSFPLHGYREVPTPRDPAYLSNLVEPTGVLRVTNIDWDRSEDTFRGVLTQQDGVVSVHRITSQPDSPALVQFNSVESAVHSCILLHNQEIDGKVLYVTFSDSVPGI